MNKRHKKHKMGTNNKNNFEVINDNRTHIPWSAFGIYRNLDFEGF